MPEQRDEQRRERPNGTGRALLWTAGSTLVPGIAHLRTGRRWAGGLILFCYVALIAAAVVGAVLLNGDVIRGARIAVQGRWLLTAAALAFAVAVLWMTVIIHSYVITRPPNAGVLRRFAAGAVVTVLCLVVAAPAAAVMRTSYTAHDMFSSVFSGAADPAEPHDDTDPWAGRDRVDVLLIGGDSGDNRYGMRTDSMMVASIDVEHGDVVLIGLPRNLENAPFPEDSALAELYPEPQGFSDLLNEVYQTVAEDPEELAIDPTVQDPAADTLKQTIGHAIGIDIDYYALVDMQGFEDLVDAIGGIDVYIEDPIPYGQEDDVLETGRQHLDGNEALWYGRSRVNSDDYTRMGRQGCLVKYMAEQVDPTLVLTGFQDLAGATKRTLRTDIPQPKVPHFVDLADLAAEGGMKTLQLSPPQVDTAYPDWEKIRGLVDAAIREQEESRSSSGESTGKDGSGGNPEDEDMADLAGPSPSASAPGSPSPSAGDTEWQEYTGLPDPSPTTPGRQVGDEATSLDRLCP
ncbi:LCP family protein required for cell wall assembly [Spinactinospora alkalitolerans]|uniref:LCP family protein required for cell wall assembly n=1 Tax=Spinactinospora alkalitolerans TaxID=687207 RepID=A0A852U328_9ACTN|nr:LCP family protein [Spinactinospora alkalitolerans]NYE48360.1 LCP family protein required for cell wall assembly [Spinactinospora alkalitolerans]